MHIRWRLLLFSIGLALFVRGQQPQQHPSATTDTLPAGPKKGFFGFLSPHKDEAQKGKFLVTPFLFPGYSPDIQYSLAGGGIFSFKTNPHDSLLPRSSVPV